MLEYCMDRLELIITYTKYANSYTTSGTGKSLY